MLGGSAESSLFDVITSVLSLLVSSSGKGVLLISEGIDELLHSLELPVASTCMRSLAHHRLDSGHTLSDLQRLKSYCRVTAA